MILVKGSRKAVSLLGLPGLQEPAGCAIWHWIPARVMKLDNSWIEPDEVGEDGEAQDESYSMPKEGNSENTKERYYYMYKYLWTAEYCGKPFWCLIRCANPLVGPCIWASCRKPYARLATCRTHSVVFLANSQSAGSERGGLNVTGHAVLVVSFSCRIIVVPTFLNPSCNLRRLDTTVRVQFTT